MIHFSFIIPHKNLPTELLRKCLDSIPLRDDVEIIVIDDNSDFTYTDKAELSSLGDSRTQIVFDTSSKGPGNARNLGMKMAKGEWLLFADADDFYEKDNLNLFLEQLLNCNADVVYMGIRVLSLDGSVADDNYSFPCDKKELLPVESKDVFLHDQHQSWRRAIRADFLREHNIEYPSIRYCEDQSMSVKALLYVKAIMVFPLPVYCYVRREGSITKQLSRKDLTDALYDCFAMNRLIGQHNYNVRLSVPAYILSLLRQKNILLFYYYALQNFLHVDKETAMSDYKKACKMSYIAENPVKVLVDSVRVKLGAIKNSLFHRAK